MVKEPLRRVLFPSPSQHGDVHTSTRSIQRIRPKAELTPVNLDSTPTFKQLVENSPVPLAVAAATAAIRAANSAQPAHGIITDMTRAAEELIKRSEHNAIRPPLPSPRSLSSPQFSRRPQPASASLPPVLSPPRPPGLMNSIRDAFSAQRTSSRSSLPPIIPPPQSAETHRVKQNKAILAATKKSATANSLERSAPPSVRPPKSLPFTENSPRKTCPGPVEKHPSPRAGSDFLSRLFGRVSPIPFAGVSESPVEGNDSPSDLNAETKTVPKTTKSVDRIKKEGSSGPRPEAAHEKRATKIQQGDANRMRTRSLKRARPRSHSVGAGAVKTEQPVKRRRMSEVLRLQKSLESAAWTNSLAVERQTEVIVISDGSPTRLRPDAVIKLENKTPSKNNGSRKFAQSKVSQQKTDVGRKPKPKESIREESGSTKLKRRSNGKREAGESHPAKPEHMVKKRRRSSVKHTSVANSIDIEEAVVVSTHHTRVLKKRRTKELKQGDTRLVRLRNGAAFEKKRMGPAKTPMKAGSRSAEKSRATPSLGQAPLKKRITAEQHIRKKLEPSLAAVSPNIPTSIEGDGLEKKFRKIGNPKRLHAPVLRDARNA